MEPKPGLGTYANVEAEPKLQATIRPASRSAQNPIKVRK